MSSKSDRFVARSINYRMHDDPTLRRGLNYHADLDYENDSVVCWRKCRVTNKVYKVEVPIDSWISMAIMDPLDVDVDRIFPDLSWEQKTFIAIDITPSEYQAMYDDAIEMGELP
jgi:hypothetical protein